MLLTAQENHEKRGGAQRRIPSGMAVATVTLALATSLTTPKTMLAADGDKPGYPTIEKTVRDETAPSDGWTEDADGSLGERLSFRLVGTLPDNLGQLTGYRYRFVDAIPSGMQMVPGSHAVMLVSGSDGTTTDLTQRFTMTYDEERGAVIISCDDLLSLGITLSPTDQVVATYDFTMTDSSVLGLETGSPSFAHIEWAELDAAGHGTFYRTMDDGANIYTYGLVITKLEEGTDKVLAGASFQVGTTDGKWMSDTGWSDDRAQARTLTTGADGTVLLPRIDGGEYLVVETSAPAGYDTADDTPVTIVAGLDGEPKALTAESSVAGAIRGVDSKTGIVTCAVEDPIQAGGGIQPGGGGQPQTPSETGDGGGISVPDTTGRKPTGTLAGLLQTGSGLLEVRPLLAIGAIGFVVFGWLRHRRREQE